MLAPRNRPSPCSQTERERERQSVSERERELARERERDESDETLRDIHLTHNTLLQLTFMYAVCMLYVGMYVVGMLYVCMLYVCMCVCMFVYDVIVMMECVVTHSSRTRTHMHKTVSLSGRHALLPQETLSHSLSLR